MSIAYLSLPNARDLDLGCWWVRPVGSGEGYEVGVCGLVLSPLFLHQLEKGKPNPRDLDKQQDFPS